MDVTGVIGGLWADREGYLDTTGTVHAYAGAARKRGATVIEHNKVEALDQRADGTWDVVTEKGVIHAEHVVNAGGLWAKQVGRMVGLDLPLSPLQHHYLVTETIPEVAALDFEVPMTVDLEGFTYIRQDQQGSSSSASTKSITSTGTSTGRRGTTASTSSPRRSTGSRASSSWRGAGTRCWSASE